MLHLEVKSGKKFQSKRLYAQATRDAGENQIPVVFWKEDRRDWMVYLKAEDFFSLVYYYLRGYGNGYPGKDREECTPSGEGN